MTALVQTTPDIEELAGTACILDAQVVLDAVDHQKRHIAGPVWRQFIVAAEEAKFPAKFFDRTRLRSNLRANPDEVYDALCAALEEELPRLNLYVPDKAKPRLMECTKDRDGIDLVYIVFIIERKA